MTTEQILEKIKIEGGEASLRDGRSLFGLFSDYTKGQLKPQANALRTFLDCRGNERILNLQNASGPAQQTEYHRLVQEMVHDYNMQEATAADVCAAFWKAAIGTEPPGLQASPAPAPKQEPKPTPNPAPEPGPKPAPNSLTSMPKEKEQSHFRKHLDGMGKKERKAFLYGLAGVFILTLVLILSMIKLAKDARSTEVSDRWTAFAIFACYLGITLWRMKRLWQAGFSFYPATGFLSEVSKAYSILAWTIHCLVIISCIFVSVVSLIIFLGFIGIDFLIGILMAVYALGLAACSAFHASWFKNKIAKLGVHKV